MFSRKDSLRHKESKTFRFAFFWFLYYFLRILQVSAVWLKTGRIYYRRSPWKDFRLHRYTLKFYTKDPSKISIFTTMPSAAQGSSPPARGWPDSVGWLPRVQYMFTLGWLPAKMGSEKPPAMAGGEAEAAHPPRLGFRRGGQGVAMRGRGGG